MFRLRDMRYFRGQRHARHAHDQVQVSVIVCGEMREDAAARMHAVHAGDVVIKPASTLQADELDATRIVCIDFDPGAVELQLGGYAWHRVDRAASAGLRFALRFLRGADVTDDIDELLAALPQTQPRDRVKARRAAGLIDIARPLRIRADTGDGTNRDAFIENVKRLPAESVPGARERYTNAGYSLLAGCRTERSDRKRRPQ
jgi:hypothetical protein